MVLENWGKKGKFRINPLEAQLGDKINKISPLDEIYPEIFWIYFIYQKRGLLKITEILKELSKEGGFTGLISELISLDGEKIKSNLSEENLKNLREDFKEIMVFFKECPLKFIYDAKELEEINNEQKISDALMNCFLELDYKFSFGYIITLGIYLKNLVNIGKMELNKDDPMDLNLENLEKNKESKEILSGYGGHFRALSLMVIPNDKLKRDWKDYFWKEGLEKTGCYDLARIFGGTIYFYGEDSPEDLTPQVKNYLKNWSLGINKKLKEIINKDLFKNYHYSKENITKDQIINGLLNREVFLCKKILGNFEYWEKEIITILHRVVLENHINLIWFNENSSKEYCEEFIFQGLSNKKLYIEKLKELNKEVNSDYQEKLIEKFEMDLEKETNPLLQNIKLSNSVDIRKKCEEANLIKLHWIYDALSDTVHSNWSFLSDKYLKPCTNPLHKRHLIPKSYYEYNNLESSFIILSTLIEILEYSKQKMNANVENEDLGFLKNKLFEFKEMFLRRWEK